MARITVKVIGPKNFAKEQLSIIRDLSERQLEAVARETETEIRSQIDASITRAGSTGKLKNSFFAEKHSEGWGIGNIEFLNSTTPYWAHVNFGSEAIGANRNFRVPRGAFQPGGSAPSSTGSKQRWVPGSGNFSFENPGPIAPRNYIAKTVAKINQIISNVLSRGI